jgi:hypothetical protein
MSCRITGIRKSGGADNPHEAISHYRWVDEQTNQTGITTRTEMVAYIDRGGTAYVRDNLGTVNCYVNTSRAGTRFLQTYSDNRWTDNLLDLPEC